MVAVEVAAPPELEAMPVPLEELTPFDELAPSEDEATDGELDPEEPALVPAEPLPELEVDAPREDALADDAVAPRVDANVEVEALVAAAIDDDRFDSLACALASVNSSEHPLSATSATPSATREPPI